METLSTQVIVIGAGVIGCAVANHLSKLGFDCVVLEKNSRIADGVTSRNSGVIHAGLYYPPSSLKAQACVRGNALLYEWCSKKNISHKKTGKWVVGDASDALALEKMCKNALDSGVKDLKAPQPISLPEICAQIGVFSPSTGIVDPYELSRSLQVSAEEKGAMFIMNGQVTAIEKSANGNWRIQSTRGALEAEIVVNCAGLYADEIAHLAGIHTYTIYPWRGDYFKLRTKSHYQQLIYPVKKPESAGLGVHLTIALDGSYRLGPDVEIWHSKEDFSPPPNIEEKKLAFLSAAQKFIPHLSLQDLDYDTCGIRPKLRSATDKSEHDFILSQDKPGWINLMGIESPGLTASLDLAERVGAIVKSN